METNATPTLETIKGRQATKRQKRPARNDLRVDPEAAIDAQAATMPDDRGSLLNIAMSAVDALHAAVLASDDVAAKTAADRYDAAVLKLNGGTFFGCNQPSNPDAGGTLAENHCRAAPGGVPKWGQRGEFLIEVAGIPAVVEVHDGLRRFYASLRFHVVNPAGPFISETGYRSHFEAFKHGQTVEQVAISAFSTLLVEQGRKMLLPEYREREANDPVRPWLEALSTTPIPETTFKEPGGQFAFAF
jgi:hypothetical protein